MNQTQDLVNHIIRACQEKKAKNIVTVNLTNFSGAICQYFVICEGNTPTQVTAIADEVVGSCKKTLREHPITVDGLQAGQWVGIDYGTVIVHIFIPELREFYDIERLWQDAIIEKIVDLD